MRKRFAELTVRVSRVHVTFSLVLGINPTARTFSSAKVQLKYIAADSDELRFRTTCAFIPQISLRRAHLASKSIRCGSI